MLQRRRCRRGAAVAVQHGVGGGKAAWHRGYAPMPCRPGWPETAKHAIEPRQTKNVRCTQKNLWSSL
jgi:hypothetical protein